MAAHYREASGSAGPSSELPTLIKTEPEEDLHLAFDHEVVERIKSEAEQLLYADHEVKEEMVIGPTVLTGIEPDMTEQSDPPAQLLPCMVLLRNMRHELQCARCRQWSLTAAALQRHQGACSGTALLTQTQEKLKIHSKESGQKDNLHSTSIKIKPTQRKEKASDASETFICHICDKEFKKKYYLTNHMIIHSKNKPFACTICDKTFKDRRNFSKHLKDHSDGKRFACEICDRRFLRNHHLTEHLRTHTGKTFGCCDICYKYYRTRHNLIAHIRWHNRVKPKKNQKASVVPTNQRASVVPTNQRASVVPSVVVESQKASEIPVIFMCDCDEIFMNRSTLTEHYRTCKKRHKQFACDILPTTSKLSKHGGEKVFSCSMCNKRFAFERNFNKHLLIHDIKCFSCDICEKKFTDKNSLSEHMDISHGGKKPIPFNCVEKSLAQEKDLTIYSRVYKKVKIACIICNKEFSNKSYLKIHSQTHIREKPYVCNVCHSRFIDNSSLTMHLLTHSEDKPFVCKICKKQCKTKPYLKVHLQIHNAVKYACEICDKKYTRKDTLNYHMRKHVPASERANRYRDRQANGPFICDICNKKYKTKDKLIEHMYTHSGDKPYTCNICQKRFTSKYKLQRHSLIHSRAKFACKLCDKTFDKKGCLTTHTRSHTEKPFGCEICDKRYSSIHHFNHHMNVHIGAKPFGCDSCDMWFARQIHLTKHQKFVHSGIRPYTCDICAKDFLDKGNIIVHLRRHSGVKPYACEVCDMKFYTKYKLKSHKVLIHGDKK